MKPSDRFDSLVQYYADMFNLPFSRLKGQMLAESSGNPLARSSEGAVGLMQLMPGTAWELGVKDRANPEESLRGGAQYMSQLLASLKLLLSSASVSEEDLYRYALVSYNAGLGYVRKALRLCKDEGVHPTWPEFVSRLPRVRVNGKQARSEDALRYALRVLPLG